MKRKLNKKQMIDTLNKKNIRLQEMYASEKEKVAKSKKGFEEVVACADAILIEVAKKFGEKTASGYKFVLPRADVEAAKNIIVRCYDVGEEREYEVICGADEH